MTKRKKLKAILSGILTLSMLISYIPATYAAQSNEYVDPAENWLSSNNRTNELDINATTTYETQYCIVCDKTTTALTYRVPEYTRSGETAYNRNVIYSDGTMIDGKSKGNLDCGTPGVDSYYTGYHWTKVVCQACGTINASRDYTNYGFNNNVYGLNACDSNFYLGFDNTTYEKYSDTQHIINLKRGEYCKFCKGTFARTTQSREAHDFSEHVDGQLGNNRFYIAEKCEDCGFETSEYVAAKSVIASYYGVEDGEAHTLTVSDLSDSGVKTSIRYGNTADSCTKTSAPNYTQAGYYTVYYEIDYSYAGEVMTESGVSYVWIVSEDDDSTIIVLPQKHEHEFHYIETVKPSCEELGYERFQCGGCGALEKRNYTPALGHDYDEVVIREATCERGGLVLTLCADCGDFYQTTTATGEHKYNAVKHNATCRNVGYTEYTCEVCGDNYINNIQPIVSHAYERVTKEPTCTEKGYTTSTCTMCGLNNVSDYTEPTGHEWDEGRTVTSSTCNAEGVMEYSCDNCGEKMIMSSAANGHTPGADATCTEPQLCQVCDIVLELPNGHDYASEITAPTCTAMGYTTYACKNCDNSYAGDYTDKTEHEYRKIVTEPTCTSHGYTTYSCDDCDAEYVSDYTDKKPHAYAPEIETPTCTDLGYTTYICECGETYKADYVAPRGHIASEWIIDVPATIERTGSKYIECTVCGATLQSAELPQLIDKDNSDEDGKSEIGDYSIILTDEKGKPIFNSELTIDVNDNVSIKLPNGRLLDFAKPTTITAFYTETQQPKENLKIFIEDANGNKAIGFTNTDGQLIVPNNKTNTNDDNGTIGKEDGETKQTFVITVTDKANVVIPNCEIYIGESNNVVVDLPDGIKPARESPVIVTITDQNGNAQADVTVIALGDADFIEKGKTDIYGKITLPTASDGYTDEYGKVNVDELNVIVNDELGAIPNAYVRNNEDSSITVTLPDDKTISYANRITVTVRDSIGNAVKDKSVTVKDITEEAYTALTDESGKIIVPPVNIDYTDASGYSEVSGYIVTVTNDNCAIENAFVTYNAEVKNEDDTVETEECITVVLSSGITFDYANRISIVVLNKADNTAVEDMAVTATETIAEPEQSEEETESEEKTETTEQTENAVVPKTLSGKTDVNGRVVFPPLNEDITDDKGDSGVEETIPGEGDDTEDVKTEYKVTVNDTKGVIENAFIKIEDGKVYITLPDTHTLTTSNQTTVTVKDNEDKAVKGVSVTIADKTTSKTGTTDANGQVTLPVKSSGGGSSSSGSSGGGSSYSGGGGGGSSYASTSVKVIDKDGKTVSVTQSVRSTKATLTLATGKNLLKDDNYYTITVTSGGKAKADYTVVLKDRNGNEVTGKTDADGKLTLPGKVHTAYIFGYGDGTFRADADMSRSEAAAIFARLIAEAKGETVSGKATFSDVSSKDWYYGYVGYLEEYDVINGYSDGTFRPDASVTRAEFVTMAVRYYEHFNEVGKSDYTVNYTDLTKTYWAYTDIAYAKHIGWLNGYADGTFKGDNNITRAEVVTVTNHATKRTPDKEYINKNVSTLNKFTDIKNNSHWAYYDIMEAANTHLGATNKDSETWVK